MSESPPINPGAPFAGKRFLVLDDEFLIGFDIQSILETAGAASVVYVSTADDARAAIDAGPPFDLAMLDVLLGREDHNSLMLAEVLAERDIPFVFITGISDGSLHNKKFPRAPVLVKPFDASKLIAAVRDALQPR